MGVTGSKGVVHYGLLNKAWSEKGLFAKMRKNVLWVLWEKSRKEPMCRHCGEPNPWGGGVLMCLYAEVCHDSRIVNQLFLVQSKFLRFQVIQLVSSQLYS